MTTSGDPVPVFDGHNDMVLAMYGDGGRRRRSFFERGESGHLDLPRMREGGFAGGIFAVFVPADPTYGRPELRPVPDADEGERPLAAPVGTEYALRSAMALTSTLMRIEDESGGDFTLVRDIAGIRSCMAEGRIAAVLHFEGAEAIDPGLNALEVLYRAGLRSLGLVWSRPNIFAEGVPFAFPHSPDTGPGLTRLGKDLVRECNRMGVMVGSDFDGCTVPAELGDATGLPRLIEALRAAGYSEVDLRKIASENWLRVLETTWS